MIVSQLFVRVVVAVVGIEIEWSRDGVLVVEAQGEPLHLEYAMRHFCERWQLRGVIKGMLTDVRCITRGCVTSFL